MRALILVAGAALALSACGGGTENEANAVDTISANTLILDNGVDANALDANTAAAIEAADGNVQNAMAQDAATNDPDTNLANGL